mmetsp:Transcript_11434/g.10096  ORF Transcript_11434/g.10096 Transcript_11434/m.10096 type:complete len:370 (+) Transcript_11434:1-1110(+)
MYYTPVPSLKNGVSYMSMPTNSIRQSLIQSVHQDQEAIPVQKTAESLDQSQLESIHQSLSSKKEQVDHEVLKTMSIFSKISKFYHIFAKIKIVIMMLFSLYHLIGGNFESSILPIILSFIMSVILFKKSMASQKALQKNDHYTVKKIFNKTLILAGIFLVVYLVWSSAILKSYKVENGVGKLDQEFVKKGLKNSDMVVDIKIDRLQYVRIGAPGAKFGKKFERNSLKEVKVDKDSSEQQLRDQYSFIYSLPKELPLYFVFIFSIIFILVKFGLFFTHFKNYKNALERQEKLNKLIEHFRGLTPPSTPVVLKEEEVKGTDYPIIEEEEVPLNRYLDETVSSLEDNKIIDIREESSYPTLTPPPQKFTPCY